MHIRYEPLTPKNLADVACCPGGAEVAGKTFRGNLEETIEWRHRMLDLGMRGIVAYDGSVPRGFVEYMPAEAAPVPIEAPGTAVLMCYHWAGTEPDDPEHLERERELIAQVVERARGEVSGLVTQGWDVPTHFPIPLLQDLGFREVIRHGDIALMWLPYEEGNPEPRLAPASYAPRDLSPDGLLAIDAAFTSRCPYSISTEARLKEVISDHPLKDRIRVALRRIDTREDALAYAVAPFDWAWVFFNGEEVALFEFPGEELATEIARRIEALS